MVRPLKQFILLYFENDVNVLTVSIVRKCVWGGGGGLEAPY